MAHPAILFANEKNEVFVLDIPTSISEAQFCSNSPPPDRNIKLFSCEPQTEPYPSTEPKSDAAASNIQNHADDEELHRGYVQIIREAYANLAIEDKHDLLQKQPWCHQRAIFQPQPAPVSKELARKREYYEWRARMSNSEYIRLCMNPGPPIEEELTVLLNRYSGSDIDWTLDAREIVPNSEFPDHFHASEIRFSTCKTTENHWLKLRAELEQPQKSFAFRLPSESTILLRKCEQTINFKETAKGATPRHKGRFSVILLDPPWPNRSVIRKLPYYVSSDPQTVRNLVVDMRLDDHIVVRGFVAVWITNKPAIRKMVLGENGIFAKNNLRLVEEWIWVKVTTTGQPVTPLEGLWRKPYEVLLIARAPMARGEHPDPPAEVKRRVIFAVPDLHSRKPCLKHLIEKLLLHRDNHYVGLEVFGRYLMANWMSWGDEVLKYNWEGYWTTTDEATDKGTGEETT